MDVTVLSVSFDAESMWAELSDGRTLGVALAWFPHLLHATPAQRKRVELTGAGLHWEELEENISVAALLARCGSQAG
jgi:Protein of unknown function (DUF2442)